MRRPDLLSVGEAFEDLVFHDLKRLPRPGEEIKTGAFTRTVGGGAVITAVAAARLGLRAAIVSGLAPGAVALMKREGVSYHNLRGDDEPAALSVSLSTRKDRSFVTFNGMNALLEARLKADVPRRAARHVHFALSPADCGEWAAVVHDLRARGMTSSWDFGWIEQLTQDTSFLKLVGELDFLMLNSEEALLYSGRRTLPTALRFFKGRARNVVVKLGRRGARWLGENGEFYSPARPVAVVDTTGAGDAWNGGFIYGLLKGLTPKQTLDLANAVGALSTRAPGGIDGLPRLNDIS